MDFQHFAKAWESGWNSHNLTAILSHYRDDVVFRSNKAVSIMGTGEVRGISALRTYWAQALEKQPDLHFTVIDVFEGSEMMVITYLNHKNVLAAETLHFDADGLVYQASACHRTT